MLNMFLLGRCLPMFMLVCSTKCTDQPTSASVPTHGEAMWHDAHFLHIHICVMVIPLPF